MDQRFMCIKDFGLRCHTDCREPYFYEAGYTHDHLPECTYTSGMHPVSRSQCTNCPLMLADHKPIVSEKTPQKKKITQTKVGLYGQV